MTDRLLVLVRHGESEWNLKNLFTGWRNPGTSRSAGASRKPCAAGRALAAKGSTRSISASPRALKARPTFARPHARRDGLYLANMTIVRNQALNDVRLWRSLRAQQG